MRHIILILAFSISLLGIHQQGRAQLRHEPTSSSEILSGIEKLNVLGTVLYFAAHPDDENTRLIAWSAQEMRYRTAYLSLTRGDGGQNLIGTELAEELGLIRTQELLAAREVDGGEQYFSRANDFGFSKTPEETLQFWGEEDILGDAVWVIRQLRPDVIITRFPPDPRGGHGHHQAATILALEAFKAAADPLRFPEQLQYVEPWQAKRLVWNAANFGGQNNTTASQHQVDIGQFHIGSGQSYGEIAAESRSKHKSQGFGAARQRGKLVEYFETLAGEPPVHSLMDGVVTSWERVAGAAYLAERIQEIAQRYDVRKPEQSLPDLLVLLEELEALPSGYWRDQKLKEVKDLILACAGIWFESYAPASKVAVGEEVQVRTDVIVRRPGIDVRVNDDLLLTYNALGSYTASFMPTQDTQPYWLRLPKIGQRFDVEDWNAIGQPGNPDDPKSVIQLAINGRKLQFERPIVYKYTHPVHGEIHQALIVSPVVTANLNQQALVFVPGAEKNIEVTFTNHANDEVQVRAVPEVPAGWSISPSAVELAFERKDQEVNHRFTVRALGEAATGADAEYLVFNLDYADAAKSDSEKAQMLRSIDYLHIPLITYFPPAEVRLSQVETGVSVRRLGYLAGAGDLVPDALRQIGIHVDLLTEQDILDRDLSVYDAIVSGIRAYNVNRRMAAIKPKLMEFVHAGGTYLMQYNVSSGLSTADFGPYPFQLSRLRVTDEEAPVRILQPDSHILNHPNQINSTDFEGWVQERGLYFPIAIDPAYELPLSMNDSGEQGLDGAVIVGKYGEGKFIYTSLAFFRQLPAGVPGAYRLFINLIAND